MSLNRLEIEERAKEIPFGFSVLEHIMTEEAREYNVSCTAEKRIVIPLIEFNSPEGRIVSNKPVSVNMYMGEELWFAENENLGIFATGETFDDAIEEFQQIIVHYYNYYNKIDSRKLDKLAGELKRIFCLEFIKQK